jgi:uncharacterized protein YecT (DUF1311 family)
VQEETEVKTRLILLAVAAVTTCVLAQPEKEPTEAELEDLVQQSPKAHYPKLIEFNEQKLERVFQVQLAKADPELKVALEKSQKAWREFYDAERLVGAIKNRGGSGSYPSTAGRRLHLLHGRIEQLAIPYLQGWSRIQKVPDPEK